MGDYSTRGDLRDPAVRNHYVYRLFDSDGRLLYVGCSIHPVDRLREHPDALRSATVRMRVQGPFNYQTARQMERDAIESEAPFCNYTSALGMQRRQRRQAAYHHLYTSLMAAEGIDAPRAMRRALPAINAAELAGAFA